MFSFNKVFQSSCSGFHPHQLGMMPPFCTPFRTSCVLHPVNSTTIPTTPQPSPPPNPYRRQSYEASLLFTFSFLLSDLTQSPKGLAGLPNCPWNLFSSFSTQLSSLFFLTLMMAKPVNWLFCLWIFFSASQSSNVPI